VYVSLLLNLPPVIDVNDSPLIACAEALGPTAVSCVSAATQEGVGMYYSPLTMALFSLS
jgi:hypothetical protein